MDEKQQNVICNVKNMAKSPNIKTKKYRKK